MTRATVDLRTIALAAVRAHHVTLEDVTDDPREDVCACGDRWTPEHVVDALLLDLAEVSKRHLVEGPPPPKAGECSQRMGAWRCARDVGHRGDHFSGPSGPSGASLQWPGD